MNLPLTSPTSLSFNPNFRRRIPPKVNGPILRHEHPLDSSPPRQGSIESLPPNSVCSHPLCSCGRRRFVQGIGSTLFLTQPSCASAQDTDPTAMLNIVHPPRPDWYEELYASVLDSGMKPYEAEIAGYKSELFANLRGNADTVLEIGIGTGPNLKFYGGDNNLTVYGIDPNKKMEKYARKAALAAGLSQENFKFVQAVSEALPLSDASVDAVIGTLVLCSVKDVSLVLKEVMRVLKPGGVYLFLEHVAAKDGSILRFVQGFLDPLQQTVADGCHLTRDTGKSIYDAGFSDVNLNMTYLSAASLINPHVYGIAGK